MVVEEEMLMWSAMLFCITVSKHLSRVLAAVTGSNGKDLWGRLLPAPLPNGTMATETSEKHEQ
jgi:hypothetical protein